MKEMICKAPGPPCLVCGEPTCTAEFGTCDCDPNARSCETNHGWVCSLECWESISSGTFAEAAQNVQEAWMRLVEASGFVALAERIAKAVASVLSRYRRRR